MNGQAQNILTDIRATTIANAAPLPSRENEHLEWQGVGYQVGYLDRLHFRGCHGQKTTVQGFSGSPVTVRQGAVLGQPPNHLGNPITELLLDLTERGWCVFDNRWNNQATD